MNRYLETSKLFSKLVKLVLATGNPVITSTQKKSKRKKEESFKFPLYFMDVKYEKSKPTNKPIIFI